ncbi:hypothetical protein [Geodermatophilus sp. SYSU D00079]
MTATRRTLVLIALTLAVILGASIPANAGFSTTEALPTMSVGTATVAPATQVRVDTSCVTTTTVIKQTYRKDPYTGATTRTGYSESRTTGTSRSNVEGDTTTTQYSSPYDWTTTRTIQNTELYATLRWALSSSGRVAGYRMTAHTLYGQFPMGETGPTATSMTGNYDASVLSYNPQLSIDTVTDYGWVGTSALSNVVRC